MRRGMKVAALVVVAVTLLAACGDDDDTSVTGTSAPPAADDASTTTAASGSGAATTTTAASSGGATTTAATGAATIKVVTTSVGEVLADADGRILYVFTVDEPDKSNCTGGCLQTWPRFAPAELVAGGGVDASLLGSISVDGEQQATIAKQPLYYFAGDSKAGDVNGQGVGGNWWVVAPDGTPIED